MPRAEAVILPPPFLSRVISFVAHIGDRERRGRTVEEAVALQLAARGGEGRGAMGMAGWAATTLPSPSPPPRPRTSATPSVIGGEDSLFLLFFPTFFLSSTGFGETDCNVVLVLDHLTISSRPAAAFLL